VVVGGWVLAFALGVTIITAVATGLLPAVRAARPDLTDSLKEGTAGAGTGHGRQRLRAALVISEIGLAVILVVGAGLLIRSLWRLRAVNPGFDPQGLVTLFHLAAAAARRGPGKARGPVHAGRGRGAAAPGCDERRPHEFHAPLGRWTAVSHRDPGARSGPPARSPGVVHDRFPGLFPHDAHPGPRGTRIHRGGPRSRRGRLSE